MARSTVLVCFLLLFCFAPSYGKEVVIGFIKTLSFYGDWAGPSWGKSASCALMAVNHINARNPAIAPALENLPEDFNVSYFIADSQLTPSVAAAHANEMVVNGADALVGPVMSASAGPASLISGIYKVPLTAYVSTAPALSDKTTYPDFGRVCMSDTKLIENIILACKQMGWSSLSVLYQDDAWGKGIAEAVNTAGGQLDVKVLTSQQFNNNDQDSVRSAVHAAAEYGGRIYIFAVGSAAYDTLFFTAEDAGIIGRGNVWVSVTSTDPSEYLDATNDKNRMQRVLSGLLGVTDRAMYGEREAKLREVVAAQDPNSMYHPVLGPKDELLPVLNGEPGGFCGYLYDATVATGLALAYAAETQEGKIDRDDVHHRLRNTDFHGATGHVQTDPETGDRLPLGITMVMSNFAPSFTEDNEPTLVSHQIAILDQGKIVKTAEPYWAGGMEGWDQVPGDGFQCKDGYALKEGTVACPKCTEGYANTTGQVECHACPSNTFRPAGTVGESIMECVCKPGTYTRDRPGTPCLECPAGAECDGGSMPPYPRVGFWGEKKCQAFGGDLYCDDWFELLECTHSDCRGGPDFECAPGRAGRLCRETADGWYNVGRIVFLECSSGGTGLAFLGIVGVVLVWTGIVIASNDYASIDVLVQFMLVNAMITSFGLKWHSKLNGLNIFLKIANFEVDFISYDCFGPWKAEHAFFFQLLFPSLITVVYTGMIALWRAIFKTTGHLLSSNALKTFISLSVTTYHTAMYKSFAAFRCENYPDGNQYNSLYPSIECWKPSHISMVVVGVLYIVVIGLGLPVWQWMRVDRHRKQGTLQDDEIDFTYGWQHRRYTMLWKNWWAVVCFRRCAVAFIAALIPWPMVQAMATVMVMTALLTAQVMVRPHASHRIDLLEFFSKVMTNLYVLGGMLMYGSITAKAQGRTCAEDATGVDAQFCQEENHIKDGIAIFSLLCMSLTLVFAGFLSFTLAWDDHNSFRASKMLARLHKTGGTKKIKDVDDEQFDHSSIGHILNSVPVLRWITKTARETKHQNITNADEEAGVDMSAGQLSSEQFSELEVGLCDLARHFNSAKSVRADILNKVCTTPGLIEWIAVETEGRESMLRFVNGFADFLRREKQMLHNNRSTSGNSSEMKDVSDRLNRSDSEQSMVPVALNSRGRHDSLVLSMMDMTLQASNPGGGQKRAMFPVSDLIKKEHLGTATYYMMTCSEPNRQAFCSLLDDILKSNFPNVASIREFARSGSGQHTPLAVVRQASSSRLRKLSLDDYQPEASHQSPRSRTSGSASPGAHRLHARKSSKLTEGLCSELYVQAHLVTPRTLPEPGAGTMLQDQTELPPSLLRRNGSGVRGPHVVDDESRSVEGMQTARDYLSDVTELHAAPPGLQDPETSTGPLDPELPPADGTGAQSV